MNLVLCTDIILFIKMKQSHNKRKINFEAKKNSIASFLILRPTYKYIHTRNLVLIGLSISKYCMFNVCFTHYIIIWRYNILYSYYNLKCSHTRTLHYKFVKRKN